MVINALEKKKVEKGDGHFWRSVASLSRMIKDACLPEMVTSEQRPERNVKVSGTTVCSCAGHTLLHFHDHHSYGYCEEPYSYVPYL